MDEVSPEDDSKAFDNGDIRVLNKGNPDILKVIYDLQEAYDGDNLCLQTLSSVPGPHRFP
ncbi:Uncharacterised protein [Actinobacillus pleuropneumoniae]|jgi:hypothetical protein|nr:Uncharacterised protein [Actinobacillus pleuropneumoniae]